MAPGEHDVRGLGMIRRPGVVDLSHVSWFFFWLRKFQARMCISEGRVDGR